MATLDFELKSPQCFLPSFEPTLIQEKRKIDFQDGPHSRHLGFQIGTILAISDQQVTQMLSIELQVKWPFGSGEVAKIGGHLGFTIGRISAILDLQVTPVLPAKFSVIWPRGVGGVGF